MSISLAVWIRIYLAGLILAAAADASAFKTDTHQKLNNKAAVASNLDTYLKEQLGVGNGLEETFKEKKVREWIELGGEAEDEFLSIELIGAALRSRHHFHNPLLPWDQAGLNATSICPPFFLSGEASIRWAQDPNQGLSGQATWNDARKSFLKALTLPSKAERDTAWAQTFQILGHQIHLIADLAAPAHTRNDAHCPSPDGFEAWASDLSNQSFIQGLLAGPPVRPDPTIFTMGAPIADPIAKVPIARLWDTDQYKLPGPTPAVTLSPTIGLAEYSNANFFSDNTIFNTDQFPFPAPTSVELGPPEPEPKTGELRRYFKKVRDGEAINHLAVPSALYEFLSEALKDKEKGLDDKVFQDYGEKLLPRTVGYSAALLDYFFRGRLFTFGDTSSLAFANYSQEPREPMEGSFTLYYDDVEEKRHPVPGASWTLTLGAGDYQGGFRFSEPVDPAPLEPGSYTLVFQGAFGGEAEAVVGKCVVIPSVLTVRLLTRIYGNPLWGYKVEAVEHGSGKVLTWARTDRNGKASMQWKPGKILIRIQTPVPVTRDPTIYWAGGNDFSSAAEGAKIVTHAEVDSKGELIITLPGIIFPQSISAVEPCTGLLKAEIPCRLANVDCLADDPSWQRPQIDNYWPDSYGTAGSLLSASGAPTGEAVYMIGSGVSPITFIHDDIDEETKIINAYEWTGKRIIPDALHAEDLNRIGVPIGRLVVSYRADYARYVENENGEMIGNPICSGSYGETVSLPVWLADYDRPAR